MTASPDTPGDTNPMSTTTTPAKFYRLPAEERTRTAEARTGTYVTAVVDYRGNGPHERYTGELVTVAITNTGTTSAEAIIRIPNPRKRARAISLATITELRPATNGELLAAGMLDVVEGRRLVERVAIVREAQALGAIDEPTAVAIRELADELVEAQVRAAHRAAGAVR
jgi:hypothetical protein